MTAVDTGQLGVQDAAIVAAVSHRARVTEAMRKARAAINEIGKLPPIVDPDRRAACERDFHRFLTTYFPESCGLAPYGAAQMTAIKRMETAVLFGGRTINLLPRGYTKSTLSEMLVLWSVLYRHKSFCLFLGANSEMADQGIESIRSELENNQLLVEDFPDPCYITTMLNGKHQRARSMTYNGKDVSMEWTSSKLVLPSLGGNVGAVISSDGLLSASRGSRHTLPSGRKVRPGLVVLDDIETEQSSVSPSEIKKRLKIITHSLSKLGGHGHATALVLNGTMLADNSLTDQLTDRKKHPGWTTTRASTVVTMPTNLESLWLGEYADLLRDFDSDDADPLAQRKALDRATEFYVQHRFEMDAGHEVSWEDIPLEPGEISALQHAMNVLIIDGEDVFNCEIQNMARKAEVSQHLIIGHAVSNRTSGLPAEVAPPDAGFMTFFIDVHNEVLYWSRFVCKQDFTGSVIDYGSWPKQPTAYFMHSNVKRTLADHYKTSVDDAVRKGLVDLIKQLSVHDVALSAGLIDAGFLPQLVEDAIRAARVENVYASKGIGLSAGDKPMTQYDVSPKRSWRAGPDPSRPRWYFPREFYKRIHFDSNFWKSFAADRLTQSAFESGAVTLFGDHDRIDHSMFADHCMAERPLDVTAKGNTVTVWKRLSRENHYWDTLIGNMVAASIGGCELKSVFKAKPKPRRPAPRRNYGASQLDC